MSISNLQERLGQAHQLARDGDVIRAELQYLEILKLWPTDPETLSAVADLALRRDDGARAIEFLQRAIQAQPKDLPLAMRYAETLASLQHTAQAVKVLETLLAGTPGFYPGWLLLGCLRDASGDGSGALRAWYQAVTRSQGAGQWLDTDTTPPHLINRVAHAVERVRTGCRELLFNSYEKLRQEVGAGKLDRVDRALTGYLGEWDASPMDARQRPKVFHFPGLPVAPYHDPFLHSWAQQLQSSFTEIRAEALLVWQEDQRFGDFLEHPPGAKVQDYLQGDGPRPSWEAFFFYRHGRRFDANHLRCPRTSEVLESIELCRIAGQAPEICFSVLSPGSHIMPHYGVTNTRLVMHLPLIVPNDCALNLIDAGQHVWQEGKLMMFDDTFQHEAWNRSDKTRIILLMDCWNPHLTQDERLAVKHLIEAISDFQNLDQLGQGPH